MRQRGARWALAALAVASSIAILAGCTGPNVDTAPQPLPSLDAATIADVRFTGDTLGSLLPAAGVVGSAVGTSVQWGGMLREFTTWMNQIETDLVSCRMLLGSAGAAGAAGARVVRALSPEDLEPPATIAAYQLPTPDHAQLMLDTFEQAASECAPVVYQQGYGNYSDFTGNFTLLDSGEVDSVRWSAGLFDLSGDVQTHLVLALNNAIVYAEVRNLSESEIEPLAQSIAAGMLEAATSIALGTEPDFPVFPDTVPRDPDGTRWQVVGPRGFGGTLAIPRGWSISPREFGVGWVINDDAGAPQINVYMGPGGGYGGDCNDTKNELIDRSDFRGQLPAGSEVPTVSFATTLNELTGEIRGGFGLTSDDWSNPRDCFHIPQVQLSPDTQLDVSVERDLLNFASKAEAEDFADSELYSTLATIMQSLSVVY